MPRLYSLAYLTTHGLDPAAAISVAARAGYDAVGIRILPSSSGGVLSPLIDNKPMLREAVKRIADTGVGVFDVELVRLAPDFTVAAFEPFLDVCAAIGAKAVLVASDDPDEARTTQSFAAFCVAAAKRNLTADLEFMPWTEVRDCATAARIVEKAGQPNGGVLVDALHWARSASSLASVAALPRTRLHYAQICDGPAAAPTTTAGLIHAARCERMLPGEGGLDLKALFAVLPGDLPISIEVPSETRVPVIGVEAWARQALVAAKAVIAQAILGTS
jgi:sugar phosphate isomerase/epimerase